ncbi:MAG: hypothetical protein R3319_01495 [Candidatus Bathyarchaeia archaeon]|nr:hypothetical protein [Candidatus Bathyarchaeia archaeon]
MSGEEEKIVASRSLIFFGNLMITVWIVIGTAAFWVINSMVGLLFLGFSVFSLLIVMRRQMCGSCYYCASCTKGFAKLSKLFLGGSSIPGISKGVTGGMTVFIYLLLSIIPGIVLVSSIFQEFSLLKLSLLIGLLLISIHNAVSRGKKLIR